jgi:hypothetical protein
VMLVTCNRRGMQRARGGDATPPPTHARHAIVKYCATCGIAAGGACVLRRRRPAHVVVFTAGVPAGRVSRRSGATSRVLPSVHPAEASTQPTAAARRAAQRRPDARPRPAGPNGAPGQREARYERVWRCRPRRVTATTVAAARSVPRSVPAVPSTPTVNTPSHTHTAAQRQCCALPC